MTLEAKRNDYISLLKSSIDAIIDGLAGKVEKISLFGSYPKGKINLFTDLDVLIIMKTDKSFLERTKELYALLVLPVDADILCYTPEEWERIKDRGFFKKIRTEEVVLYEKGSECGRDAVA